MSTPLVQQPSQPITLPNPRMSRAPQLNHSFDLPFHLPHQQQSTAQQANLHSSFSRVAALRNASVAKIPHPPSTHASPPSRAIASPLSVYSSDSMSSMTSPPQNMYSSP